MIVLSNTGASVDLLLRKGAAFGRTFRFKTNYVVTDITGYSFASQIRTQAGSLVATFSCNIVNASQGTFSIALSAAAIAALTIGTTYVWDLEASNPDGTTELMRGNVEVVAETTLP